MRKIQIVLGSVVMTLSLAAQAADPPPAPAVPPEVKKTVETFLGTWNLQTTMNMPGAAPVKFAEKIDCKKVVMGRAALCVDTFTVPGAGAMDYTYLVGYDVETKSVHIFAIGSPGEVHDHKCSWKTDKLLECETYKGTSEGKPMTEEASFAFDGNALVLKGSVVNKDGRVTTESTGKRKGK